MFWNVPNADLILLQDHQQVKWEIVEDDELLECRVPRFLSTLIIHKLHSYELHESKFTLLSPYFAVVCSNICEFDHIPFHHTFTQD